MAQFYFLSVLLNILVGLVLVYGIDLTKSGKNDERKKDKDKKNEKSLFGTLSVFENRSFRLVLGVLSILVGVMKILSPFRNDVPVVGDLLPVLAGFAGGASLLVEFYISNTDREDSVSEHVMKILIEGRNYIGIFCLAVGVLHFIFPQVPAL